MNAFQQGLDVKPAQRSFTFASHVTALAGYGMPTLLGSQLGIRYGPGEPRPAPGQLAAQAPGGTSYTVATAPFYVKGMGQGAPGDDQRMDREPGIFTSAKQSGERALVMAGIDLLDIDICELYDCYTYTVLVTLEDYGFCQKVEGEAFVADGKLGPGGALPTNTDGRNFQPTTCGTLRRSQKRPCRHASFSRASPQVISSAVWQSRLCNQSGREETPNPGHQPPETQCLYTAVSVHGPGRSSAVTCPGQAPAQPAWLQDAQRFHSHIQFLKLGDSAVGHASKEMMVMAVMVPPVC
jgi:hypothetical protein